MAVNNNMNKEDTTSVEKGRWQISLFIHGPKEAALVAEAEHLPSPDEYFDNYPTVVVLPSLYTYFQMIRKSYRFSSMGIHSKVTKIV